MDSTALEQRITAAPASAASLDTYQSAAPNLAPPIGPGGKSGARAGERDKTIYREQVSPGTQKQNGEIGHAPRPERSRQRVDIHQKTRAQIRAAMEARVLAAERAQKENRPIDRLDAMLLAQRRAYDKGDTESIFTRFDSTEMDKADLAMMWMSLSASETSLMAATGRFGEATVDDYARGVGITDKSPRQQRQALDDLTRSREEIEKTFYKSFRIPLVHMLPGRGVGRVSLSGEYRRQQGRQTPGEQGAQDGNEFHNAVARRIQARMEATGRSWEEIQAANPQEAQGILHDAYLAALPVMSDRYAQLLYDDPEAGKLVSAIEAHIADANAGRKSTESAGGSTTTEETALQRAREAADDLNAELGRRVSRRGEIDPILRERRAKKAELSKIPDKISTKQEFIRQQDQIAKDEAARAQTVTGSERVSANTAAQTARQLATDARQEVATLQQRQATLEAEIAAQGSDEEMARLQSELDILNREINGVPGDPNDEVRRGFKTRKEEADEATRQAQRALENRRAELARNKPSAEGEQKGDPAEVGRLTQWQHVASATGVGAIQAAFLADRDSTRAGGLRQYGGAQLGSAEEVGYRVGETQRTTVRGAERIRELIFHEAALAVAPSLSVGARYDEERAREALTDETIVRAMIQVDDRVGSRELVDQNGKAAAVTVNTRTVRTVDELLNEMTRLRNEGAKEDNATLLDYQLRVARSAMPALAQPDWISYHTQDLISHITFKGVRSAATGHSILDLGGRVERQGGVRIENAMEVAYDGVGQVTLERVYDRGRLGMNIIWQGQIQLATGSGPGAEFPPVDPRSTPVLEATARIEVRQDEDADIATWYVDLDINQGLRARLPRVLEFNDYDELRTQMRLGADVDNATLRYILEHFYRSQEGEQQAEAHEAGTQLRRYPRVFNFPRVEGRSTAPGDPWADALTLQQERDGLRLAQALDITEEDVESGREALQANLTSARGVDRLAPTERQQLERFAGDDDRPQEEVIDWHAARMMAVINGIEQPQMRAEVQTRYMLQQMFPGLYASLQTAGTSPERQGILNRIRIAIPARLAQNRAGVLTGDARVNLVNAANDEDVRVVDYERAFAAIAENDEAVLEALRMDINGLRIQRVIPRARTAEERIGNLQFTEDEFIPDAIEFYWNPQTEEELTAARAEFEGLAPEAQRAIIGRMVIARALGVPQERVQRLSDDDVFRVRGVIERAWEEQDRILDNALTDGVEINLATAETRFAERYPEEADQIRVIQEQQEAFDRLPRREQRLRRTLASTELSRMENADRQAAFRQIDVARIAADPANGYGSVADFLAVSDEEVTRMLGNQQLLRRVRGLTPMGRDIAQNVAVIESLIVDRLRERTIEQQAIESLAREDEDDWDALPERTRARRLRVAEGRWRGTRRRAENNLTEDDKEKRLQAAKQSFGEQEEAKQSAAIAAMRERLLARGQNNTEEEIGGRYVLQAAGRGTGFRLRAQTFRLPGQNGTTAEGQHPDTGMAQLLEPPTADDEESIQHAAMRNIEIATANAALYEVPFAERVGGRIRFRTRGPMLAAFTVAPIEGQVPGQDRQIDSRDEGRVILTNEGIFLFVKKGETEGTYLDAYYDRIMRDVNVTDRTAYLAARQRIHDMQQLVGRQIFYSFPRR